MFDDFYNPSEFEIQIEEFKESLRQSVKTEILQELKELREENDKLHNIKARMHEIEREHAVATKQAEAKVRKERFADILEACSRVYYRPTAEFISKPKCDKCDDARMITYKTPRGREAREYCECHDKITKLKPVAMYVCEIAQRNGEIIVWHKAYENRDGYTHATVIHREDLCDSKEFDAMPLYNAYFESEENCAAYCEWLNKLEVD